MSESTQLIVSAFGWIAVISGVLFLIGTFALLVLLLRLAWESFK